MKIIVNSLIYHVHVIYVCNQNIIYKKTIYNNLFDLNKRETIPM